MHMQDTGDTRETPAIDVCKGLMADNAMINIYDPKVTEAQIHNDLSLGKFMWDHPTTAGTKSPRQNSVSVFKDAYEVRPPPPSPLTSQCARHSFAYKLLTCVGKYIGLQGTRVSEMFACSCAACKEACFWRRGSNGQSSTIQYWVLHRHYCTDSRKLTTCSWWDEADKEAAACGAGVQGLARAGGADRVGRIQAPQFPEDLRLHDEACLCV